MDRFRYLKLIMLSVISVFLASLSLTIYNMYGLVTGLLAIASYFVALSLMVDKLKMNKITAHIIIVIVFIICCLI